MTWSVIQNLPLMEEESEVINLEQTQKSASSDANDGMNDTEDGDADDENENGFYQSSSSGSSSHQLCLLKFRSTQSTNYKFLLDPIQSPPPKV